MSTLLERGGELELLSGCLARAQAGDGQLVLVEGPAGIGKTRLLEACTSCAAERGMAVLGARADEVVMEASFATVRELLWPVVRDSGPRVLTGAASLAAPVFADSGWTAEDRDRVGGVLYGLYWLVATLAEELPLLIAIDDAQWLDTASLRFVAFLARRIDSLAMLVVLGLRRGERRGPLESAVAANALGENVATVLHPRSLSAAATAELVRAELGPRADEELCEACHRATGGNPFYLHELMTALQGEGGRPTTATAARVRALGAGAIGKSVLVRVARLGSDCELLAEALSVLAPRSPLRHVALLAGLDRDRAAAAADALRAADLLADEAALSFSHPIVRDAIAAEIEPSRRAGLHSRAARILAHDGAPPDRVAAHLLSAEPYAERWVVQALRDAGAQALGQGAPEAAVSYLRRALAEPPAPDTRLGVLLELGRAETMLPVAQDFAALRAALELAGDPRTRAGIALELALALFGVIESAAGRGVLEEALTDEASLGPELVERLEAALIGGGAPDLAGTQAVVGRAARHFERARRGEVRDPRMLTALAMCGAATGLPAATVTSLAREALRSERLLTEWLDDGYVSATAALAWADQLDEAAKAQDAGITEAQRRGWAAMFMQISAFRAETACRAGDLSAAEDHGRRAYELARELGAVHFAVTWLIAALIERGRAEVASELIESVPLTDALLESWAGAVLLAHRGRARVASGRLELGVADLLDADRRMTEAGCDLSVLTDWVPATAQALAALGRHDHATVLAQAELGRAAAFGATRRHGIALSLHGLIGRRKGGIELLHRGVEVLEGSSARLEYARALVQLGAGLRARGERLEAREPLLRGLDTARRCGAEALAEHARVELVASGARPRREALTGPGALTPAEMRIARMAAEGLTNREIAQALFVSVKTVEMHLSQAYGKLGIRGRAELASALIPG